MLNYNANVKHVAFEEEIQNRVFYATGGLGYHSIVVVVVVVVVVFFVCLHR